MSDLPQLGIVDAADRDLEQVLGGGPNMLSALRGFFRPLALAKVTQRIVDFQTVEVEVPLATLGVIVALDGRALELKPEGTRSWDWKQIFALSELVLTTEDVVVYRGVRYRVMKQRDYNEYGFVNYEVVNDYGHRL